MWYIYSSLRPVANLSLQSIGLCGARVGEIAGSPMLCILLRQKLVLVEIMTLHIPIIEGMEIKDGGENGHDTTQWNAMNKPYIVLLKEYGLERYSLFLHGPLFFRLRRLETIELSIFFLCP